MARLKANFVKMKILILSYFILAVIFFQGICFAEQKFKSGENENNYTKKESVQYLKNLLATDPGFRAVYMKAKDCIKKRDYKGNLLGIQNQYNK
jgi:hypothetical protein